MTSVVLALPVTPALPVIPTLPVIPALFQGPSPRRRGRESIQNGSPPARG